MNAHKTYQFESKQELARILSQVKDLITVKKSYTNYVFTYGDLALDLAQFVMERGFLPRTYELEILKNAARYSIIKLEDYPAFNQAVMKWRENMLNKKRSTLETKIEVSLAENKSVAESKLETGIGFLIIC